MSRAETPEAAEKRVIGQPLDRVDGRLKVTGGARYSAEMPVTDPLQGVLVTSTIARGRIVAMDTKEAEKAPGVRLVLTPFNAPKLETPKPGSGNVPAARNRRPTLLQDDLVHYNNQPIGVVVADTLEAARYAASLVDVVSAPAVQKRVRTLRVLESIGSFGR